jgi:outer membrane receptor for ferrienterochelin and colicins
MIKGYIVYQNSEGYSFSKGFSGAWNHTFLNRISISLNFNHQLVKYSQSQNNKNVLFDVEHSPKWTAGLNLKFPLNKNWSLNSSSNFVGVMQLPKVFDLNQNGELSSKSRPEKSKPFNIHNINVEGKLSANSEIYFGILNLFNFRQKESPLVGYNDPNFNKGFSPFFDTSYNYAPNHGLEFFIGYKFGLQGKIEK